MLRNLNLSSIYDSSENNIINELFVPLLENSATYKRGVGYFTSGWLSLSAQGLVQLAKNGGYAEIITSPHIEEADWHAFLVGTEAQKNELLYLKLKERVQDFENTLKTETYSALAWMIADGILTIKFAIPRNKIGDFHDKYAIFEDENGDMVAIHGSFNDSIKASYNGEGISVYKSWIEGQFEFVQGHLERYTKLFNKNNDYYEVFSLPEAIKEDISKRRHRHPRPYKERSNSIVTKGTLQVMKLYDFQKSALDKWFDADCQGLFEMATGTGKTFTSLSCAAKLSEKVENITIIITVPFNHLVDQWAEEAELFNFAPILCRGNYTKWFPKLRSRIQDINLKVRSNLCVICTNDTGSDERFIKLVSSIKGEVLFIGDEVHYLGSKKYQNLLLGNFKYRIGLSATPDRWYDDIGTQVIKNYFKNEIINLPLKKAIDDGFLTPYKFIPHPVSLSDDEMEEYYELTEKIRKISMFKSKDSDSESLLAKYLRDRAKVIAKAKNKKGIFIDLFIDKISSQGIEQISHTIVYCAVGETGEYSKILSKLGLRVHEFIYTVSPEKRIDVLDQFDKGDIQILVAIKCLDEGVNIPATKEAYFLANTTNPREFVQRRGRILRKSPGKSIAILHDFSVMPMEEHQHSNSIGDSILRREMPRFAEFADASQNEFAAREVLFPMLKKYDLLPLFDKKPWDVYKENKIRNEDNNYYGE